MVTLHTGHITILVSSVFVIIERLLLLGVNIKGILGIPLVLGLDKSFCTCVDGEVLLWEVGTLLIILLYITLFSCPFIYALLFWSNDFGELETSSASLNFVNWIWICKDLFNLSLICEKCAIISSRLLFFLKSFSKVSAKHAGHWVL